MGSNPTQILCFSYVYVDAETRQVKQAWCSCYTSLDTKCKHAAALYLKINEERLGNGKRDSEQRWLTPSQKSLDHYHKGETVEQIFSDYHTAKEKKKKRKSGEPSRKEQKKQKEVRIARDFYVQKPFLEELAWSLQMCGLSDSMLCVSLKADTDVASEEAINQPVEIIHPRKWKLI